MTESTIVLADDLTGATELAGVALRYGFRAKVLTHAEPYTSTATEDRTVLCYDTDTRKLSAYAAAARTRAFATALSAYDKRLFKKTDSLLRGHPAVEIEALLQFPQWRRALLCPANPGRGRTIKHDNYYVDDTLLARSHLADDPEHPRTSSNVYELLKSADPAIEVPTVASAQDLQTQASRLTPDVLPAGGAEFFAAILAQQGHAAQQLSAPALPVPWLLVCGSRTGWQQGREHEALAHDIPCHEALAHDIPCLFADSFELAAFQRNLKTHRAVWLAVGEPAEQAPASHWLGLLAARVAQCLDAERIGTLFLEGGATARAVLDRCDWSTFDVAGELAPGCVAMRADDPAAPLLVTKPGSYAWPESLWLSHSVSSALDE